MPGLREIPDNLLISCYFPTEIRAAALQPGDCFTVAVLTSRTSGSFGSAVHLSQLPPDTLIEFVVVGKSLGSPQSPPTVRIRARAILIPHPRLPGWDLEIPVATASLLHPAEAGPCEANRFESARRGDEMGAALGMVLGQDAHYYFLFGSVAKLGGYMTGRMKEDAAGTSFVAGTIEAGTECVVRINRRILFQ
ncbi:MAG: hypothetical protein NZM10_04295 [Fimbriimonadales bacterium]|nr:hypothetical protein [Fimbriimonadales bacterium]